MSMLDLHFHRPDTARDIERMAKAYDQLGDTSHPILMFAPRYAEAKKYGVLFIGEHELLCGPLTRKRARRPEDSPLL